MVDLEMAAHKEHATLDCYVKTMEPVHQPAQLMEDLGMEQWGALVMEANCVKQMEYALKVCILQHIRAVW